MRLPVGETDVEGVVGSTARFGSKGPSEETQGKVCVMCRSGDEQPGRPSRVALRELGKVRAHFKTFSLERVYV